MVESQGMKHGRAVFTLTILLYTLLWFVPDKKMAFLLIGTYMISLIHVLGTVEHMLLIAFAGLVPLTFGKLFPIGLVSAEDVRIVGRTFGINADVVVTIREVIVGCMAFIHVTDVMRLRTRWYPTTPIGWALIGIPIALLFSIVGGSILPSTSFAHMMFWWEAYVVYRFATSRGNGTEIRLILAATAASLFAESLITMGQGITGGPLGLVIEYMPDSIPIDVTPDAGGSLLRFGGTFAYANNLANYLVFVLPMLLPALYDRENTFHVPTLYALILGFAALIVTLSRSAWIGISTAVIMEAYILERIFGLRMIRFKIPKSARLGIVVMCMILLFVLLPRIVGTTNSFDRYGSIRTRELLLEDAWKTVRQHPIFGVGLELWAYDRFLASRGIGAASVFSYFPEPVHNGLMKILVETGLCVLIPYLFFWYVLGTSTIRTLRKQNNIYSIGLLAACVGVLINIQMQPLLPDLPFVTLLYSIIVEKHRDTIRGSHA